MQNPPWIIVGIFDCNRFVQRQKKKRKLGYDGVLPQSGAKPTPRGQRHRAALLCGHRRLNSHRLSIVHRSTPKPADAVRSVNVMSVSVLQLCCCGSDPHSHFCVRTRSDRDEHVFVRLPQCGTRINDFSMARSNNCVRSPSAWQSWVTWNVLRRNRNQTERVLAIARCMKRWDEMMRRLPGRPASIRSWSMKQCQNSYCEREGIVIGPHLLGESAQGIYYLTSGKLKGKNKCLKTEMKRRRKMKLMKKSANVRCAKDECDNSKTETDYEDCNTTRILTCSLSVFSRCRRCWVSCCASCWSCASCRQWCSCRCDRPLILYPKFLHISHRENGSFDVLSLQLLCNNLWNEALNLSPDETNGSVFLWIIHPLPLYFSANTTSSRSEVWTVTETCVRWANTHRLNRELLVHHHAFRLPKLRRVDGSSILRTWWPECLSLPSFWWWVWIILTLQIAPTFPPPVGFCACVGVVSLCRRHVLDASLSLSAHLDAW